MWSQDQDYTLTPTLALTPPLLKAAGVEAWGSGERPGILNRVEEGEVGEEGEEEEKEKVRLFKHHTLFFFEGWFVGVRGLLAGFNFLQPPIRAQESHLQNK